MQWFLFTRRRIFGTPKSPVLFIHESIQVEMSFICEPDAANIKSFIINHCENLVRKVKLCRTAFMSMADFGFCMETSLVCFSIFFAYLNASNQSLTQFFGQYYLGFAEHFQKLWRHFQR
ncbi:hypothetical protein AVEN_255655-1 [Araneus ventricosus]|uniref:Uncharacterized protein n=1 Tax=Araneus ventricosus TaxID=182803 RepID=A0A4Y2H1Y8_ARAVE|nr:hypothetical protein AVEN_255655-1 [Araneus ventricosus]